MNLEATELGLGHDEITFHHGQVGIFGRRAGQHAEELESVEQPPEIPIYSPRIQPSFAGVFSSDGDLACPHGLSSQHTCRGGHRPYCWRAEAVAGLEAAGRSRQLANVTNRRVKVADNAAAVQVNDHVAPADQAFEDVVGQNLRVASVGVAGEYAVEVHLV